MLSTVSYNNFPESYTYTKNQQQNRQSQSPLSLSRQSQSLLSLPPSKRSVLFQPSAAGISTTSQTPSSHGNLQRLVGSVIKEFIALVVIPWKLMIQTNTLVMQMIIVAQNSCTKSTT